MPGAHTKIVKNSGGDFLLRGLKRGEVKALKKAGVRFGMTLAPEELDNAVDKSLAVVLSKEQFRQLDDLYESEVMELYMELTRLTYPTPDQEKN